MYANSTETFIFAVGCVVVVVVLDAMLERVGRATGVYLRTAESLLAPMIETEDEERPLCEVDLGKKWEPGSICCQGSTDSAVKSHLFRLRKFRRSDTDRRLSQWMSIDHFYLVKDFYCYPAFRATGL